MHKRHGLLIGGTFSDEMDAGFEPVVPELGGPVASLFVGSDSGFPPLGGPGKPKRAAIICARSCMSLCLALSVCSFILMITLSMSVNNANLASNLCNCQERQWKVQHHRRDVKLTWVSHISSIFHRN